MHGTPDNPTPACILAGGLSARLRAVAGDLPKPMVPVAGRPFLLHLLEHLASAGFGRFILAVCYRAEVIQEFFGDGSAFGWRIEYSVEPEPLGTGGGLVWAQPLWGRRALVLNGDTYLPADWPAMLAAHEASALPATMAVVRSGRGRRFGRVRLRAGRVVEFLEKPPGAGAGWINGGAYVLDADALSGRRRGEAFSLERDLFCSLAGRIGAFPCEGADFADIGTPESLERFRRIVEARRRKG